MTATSDVATDVADDGLVDAVDAFHHRWLHDTPWNVDLEQLVGPGIDAPQGRGGQLHTMSCPNADPTRQMVRRALRDYLEGAAPCCLQPDTIEYVRESDTYWLTQAADTWRQLTSIHAEIDGGLSAERQMEVLIDLNSLADTYDVYLRGSEGLFDDAPAICADVARHLDDTVAALPRTGSYVVTHVRRLAVAAALDDSQWAAAVTAAAEAAERHMPSLLPEGAAWDDAGPGGGATPALEMLPSAIEVATLLRTGRPRHRLSGRVLACLTAWASTWDQTGGAAANAATDVLTDHLDGHAQLLDEGPDVAVRLSADQQETATMALLVGVPVSKLTAGTLTVVTETLAHVLKQLSPRTRYAGAVPQQWQQLSAAARDEAVTLAEQVWEHTEEPSPFVVALAALDQTSTPSTHRA